MSSKRTHEFSNPETYQPSHKKIRTVDLFPDILLSLLTQQDDNSWQAARYHYQLFPSESREIIYCCIDEFNNELVNDINIGFDIWNNNLEVDVIAFFRIDGNDMGSSLAPIIMRGQSYRSTGLFHGNSCHFISLQRSQIAEDPDEIEYSKLGAVGKIGIDFYQFNVIQAVSSTIETESNPNLDVKLKCKLTKEVGEIFIKKGEELHSDGFAIAGEPDLTQVLKHIDIYYYTPKKYMKTQIVDLTEEDDEEESVPTDGPITKEDEKVEAIIVQEEDEVDFAKVCRYSLMEVQAMDCETLVDFIVEILDDKIDEKELVQLESNDIDGNFFVTQFDKLRDYDIDTKVLEMLENILKLLE